MDSKRYYFSTRDLLMMAALAALGGVVGTYVNALGDLFQALFGFAGTTQWAAGLHVLWLTLAVGLTGKQGAGTFTGVLKGAVELLSGNTHGLLVVLVDVVAGLLVDVGFLPFRDKERLPAYVLAGGLASASNVFVFQLFAALPADMLAYGAILLVGGVAFLSGALFAGLVARVLLNALRGAGVVKDRPPVASGTRWAYPAFLLAAALLTVGFGAYLRGALRGPVTVHVGGAVAAPYDYPLAHGDLPLVTAEGTLRGATVPYTGIPVRDLVERARPLPGVALLLIQASDGYAFFVSMEEVRASESLLLSPQGKGSDVSYNIVGASNSKAWIRGVRDLTLVAASTLDVNGALESPRLYNPDDWQFDMDSIGLDVGEGPLKAQGVALGKVLASMQPQPDAQTVLLQTSEEPVVLALADVLADDDVRIFTIIHETDVTFAVARMDGTVLAPRVTHIEVKSE